MMIKEVAANVQREAGAVAEESVRAALEQLIRTSGEGYAAVSRLLGRNPAYIQQFIKRGVPRRLSEIDRRLIAIHFGVSEDLLGAPANLSGPLHPRPQHSEPMRSGALHPGPMYSGARHEATPHASSALCVPHLGASPGLEPPIMIDPALLRPLPATRLGALAAHRVEGDGMAPTLADGDILLVDLGDRGAPRDGLHIIDSDGAHMVKRLSIHPVTRRIAILSDNSAYPSFPDCDPGGIVIVGRVIWVGRRLP